MSDIITLKALCEELKIDPREARESAQTTYTMAMGERFQELR